MPTCVCTDPACALSPVLVEGVSALVQRHGFDLVASQLARLGLEPRGDVCLEGAVLTLNRPNLHFKSCRVGLTPGGRRLNFYMT